MHQLDLFDLGWGEHFASFLFSASPEAASDDTFPARVVRVDRGACEALTDDGAVRAVFSAHVAGAASADPVSTPCVGDWIIGRRWPDHRVTVERLLPRRTAVVRAAVSPGVSHGQVLAANVDVAVVVEGLLPEPDLARIERLLALAWESGATPLVVLTKSDLVPDADQVREDVSTVAVGVDVIALSAASGQGLAALSPYLAPGRTLVFLGPSGSGKSTLTNALTGADVMATRELRADGRGRHTTAHRELVVLPGGALVIDTPGLRSVGLPDVSASLEQVFADVEALAAACRFTDCAHESEPACAVLAAAESGVLPERRLASYRKLLREARWMAARHDARLRAEERSKWKRIHKEVRAAGRGRP